MDVLSSKRRRTHRLRAMLAPSCVGLLGLAPACNALVGVDFGAAHLEEGGTEVDAGSPVDGAGHDAARDARKATDAHDGAADGTHPHDGTTDAHDAGAEATTHDGGVDGAAESGTKDAAADAMGDSGSCNGAAAPSAEPCVIAEAYGVFVAPAAHGGSDASGDGSRAHPYATIGHGIASAKGKRVYACAATYAEQLTVSTNVDGIGIYGGLACPATADAGATGDAHAAATPWTYTGIHAAVAPATVGYALQVTQLAAGAHFEDMSFVALPANASGGTASSIGVMISASTGVSFTRVAAGAGAGLAGTNGAVPASNACKTTLAGGSNTLTTPGTGGTCTCPISGSSAGGVGVKNGTVATATSDGTATPVPTDVVAGRDGLPGANGINVASTCHAGDPGAAGNAGAAGTAATAGALGATGWTVTTGGQGGTG